MNSKYVRLNFFAAGFACLFLACRTVPDIQPFAAATSQLAGSIKSTGRMVSSEIDFMSRNWQQPRRDQALTIATNFNKQWVERNALADALLEYSSSITAIAQAGEKGEASARAVATSFKKLTDAVGVALPGAGASGEIFDVAAMLYGKFAQDHAAKSLAESMQRLQTAVDATASVLNHSLTNVENGLDAVLAQVEQNIEDERVVPGATLFVRTERNNLKTALDQRHRLLGTTNKSSQQIDELRQMEASIKTSVEALAPFNERKSIERERLLGEIDLVRMIRGGLNDWASAHARLAAAALEKKPLQVEDLVQTGLEIQELIRKYRMAKKE